MRRFRAASCRSFRDSRGRLAPTRAQRQLARPGAGPAAADASTASCAGPISSGAPPVEPALVRRFRAALLRLAEAGREGGLALRGRARRRRRRSGCRTRRRRPRRRPTAAGTRPRRRLLGARAATSSSTTAAPAARIAVTRTIGAESSAALGAQRHPRHLRPRRQPLHRPGRSPERAALVTQLTDVAPEAGRAAPHRQPEVHARRGREADRLHPRAEGRQAEGRGESQGRRSCPPSSCRIGRRAADLMLSPDDTHVFILVAERPAGAKNTIVPNYVTESGYTEDIPGTHQRRRHAGSPPARRAQPQDRQERVGRRQLRAAGGGGRTSRRRRRARSAPARRRARAGAPIARFAGRCRWSRPTAARWSRPRGPRTTRTAGSSRSIRRPARRGSSTRCTDEAWVREAGSRRRARWSSFPTTGASRSSRSATAGCTSTRSTSRRRARRRSS